MAFNNNSFDWPTVAQPTYPGIFSFNFHDNSYSGWKAQRKADIDKVWYDGTKNSGCLAAICNTCGGSSISNCECARKRFVDGLTEAKLEEYLDKDPNYWKRKNADLLEDLWRYRVAERSSVNKQIACPRCKNANLLICPCQKATYMEFVTREELEAYRKYKMSL